MKGPSKIIYVILFSMSAFFAVAQPLDQPPDPAGDPDAVPVTGLEYLLVGGGIYGVSKLLNKRKGKN